MYNVWISGWRERMGWRLKEKQEMAQTDLDIVFIGGCGRSGSTLLLRMLGTIDNHVPVGELSRIWPSYFVRNHLCGCAVPFRDCEFWNAVMDDAFGGMNRVDVQHVIALQKRVEGWRHLPFLAWPKLRPPKYRRQLQEYAGILEAIYMAIQEVSGCNVIVDSSKLPTHAFVLAEIPGVNLKMIQLVRDSRAVAYSWLRPKIREEAGGKVVYMKQFNPIHIAVDWIVNDTFLRLASRRFSVRSVYRYEDIARQPRRTLVDMVTRLGTGDEAALSSVSDHAINLDPDHSVWGNPDRFKHGHIAIRPDVEWQLRMPVFQRLQVGLITLPWLAKYGYLTRAQASPILQEVPKEVR
jgi:hypothetical protein